MPCRAMNPDSDAVYPKHFKHPSGLGLTGISLQGGKNDYWYTLMEMRVGSNS